MEKLEQNIAEYTERAFSKYFGEVEVMTGRTITEGGNERPLLAVKYEGGFIEIEGGFPSELLYRVEQIINLIKVVKCTK